MTTDPTAFTGDNVEGFRVGDLVEAVDNGETFRGPVEGFCKSGCCVRVSGILCHVNNTRHVNEDE